VVVHSGSVASGCLSPSAADATVAEARHGLLLICWFENLEAAHQRLVDAHHRARVVELAAVVGRAK